MTDRRELRMLSVVALLLALGAVLAGEGGGGDDLVEVDLRDLARTIALEADHFDVEEVTRMLSSGSGLDVIDLRDSSAFASSHIPGARHCPVEDLLDLGLREDTPVLLYSEGGLHSVQAWMLLKAAGHQDVYTLRGGWNAWEKAHTTHQPAPAEQKSRPKPAEERIDDEKLPWEC